VREAMTKINRLPVPGVESGPIWEQKIEKALKYRNIGI